MSLGTLVNIFLYGGTYISAGTLVAALVTYLSKGKFIYYELSSSGFRDDYSRNSTVFIITIMVMSWPLVVIFGTLIFGGWAVMHGLAHAVERTVQRLERIDGGKAPPARSDPYRHRSQ